MQYCLQNNWSQEKGNVHLRSRSVVYISLQSFFKEKYINRTIVFAGKVLLINI